MCKRQFLIWKFKNSDGNMSIFACFLTFAFFFVRPVFAWRTVLGVRIFWASLPLSVGRPPVSFQNSCHRWFCPFRLVLRRKGVAACFCFPHLIWVWQRRAWDGIVCDRWFGIQEIWQIERCMQWSCDAVPIYVLCAAGVWWFSLVGSFLRWRCGDLVGWIFAPMFLFF